MTLLLALACTPDPALALREFTLDGPATTLFFSDDETLAVVAGGTLYRIGVFGGDPEVVATGVDDATPLENADQMLIHTAAGKLALLFPDGILVPLADVASTRSLTGSTDGRLAVWNDANLSVYSLDVAAKLVTQLGISGHLLGLSDDADQVLVADDALENWYLVYLDDAHVEGVRYPASPDILDIELVARQPRYAEVFTSELVVADGAGNVPMDAFTAGDWVTGAFVPDGSAVLTLESDGPEALFVRYQWDLDHGDVRGRGKLRSMPARVAGPPFGVGAAASPDGLRLAVGTPEGVAVLYQPSNG